MSRNVHQKIRLGISSCLLGNRVRYDGGHKLDRFLTDTLGRYAEFVPVCPEVECGLGVPREPMRLVGDPHSPRLVTIRTAEDHTERMLQWAQRRVVELEEENLCGFIFKSRSPSSGMERVKVYGVEKGPIKTGVGLFAGVFMGHFPLVPVEDEGRLHDPELRENFVDRIFTFRRWRTMRAQSESHGDLVSFHTGHKLLIMAHSPKHARLMGRLVAGGHHVPPGELYRQYQELLMAALTLKATRSKNTAVLRHVAGYFSKQLAPAEKHELREIIDSYRQGHVPLIVPITLINHYVRKYDDAYLKGQHYLDPEPAELQLRNHA